MKTFMASPATIERKWYVVDADGMTLGRCKSIAGEKQAGFYTAYGYRRLCNYRQR